MGVSPLPVTIATSVVISISLGPCFPRESSVAVVQFFIEGLDFALSSSFRSTG